jgi:LysR family transcriptional activator of nhaA
MEYADEMFSLSAELEQALRHHPKGRPVEFRVGVSDAVPKSLAYRLLHPAVDPVDPVRIICREWRLDRLLAELAIHRLDLVIADSPIPPSVDVRAYNHLLGDSGLSFFAARALVDPATPAFPRAWERCRRCCLVRIRRSGASLSIGWTANGCAPASPASLTIPP